MVYDIQKLVDLYNSGMSYEQIAVTIGKSKKLISKLLKGNITPRKPIRKTVQHEIIKWSTIEERDKLILNLYNQNNGTYKISKILKISKRTVSDILKLNNITIRNKQKSLLDINKINDLYNSGRSISDIAKLYNISDEAIRYHIKNPRNNHDTLSIIPINLQKEILKLVTEEKLSSYKIAEKHGFSYQSVQHFLKRHGLSPGSYTKEWKEAVQRGIKTGFSSLEKKVAELLNNNNIQYEREFAIEDFRYDFKICNESILIEVQGSYWHSKKQRTQRDGFKRKLAHENGYKLLIIWDYELSKLNNVLYKIRNAINPSQFNFKQCSIDINSWNNISPLLEQYHYQGHGRAGISITASYDNNIVAACVFSTCVRQEMAKKQNLEFNEILELNRLIILPQYQARNFATWFLSKSIKLLNTISDYKRLISFADPTFGHDGTIYRANNWEFDGVTAPSYWYYHRRMNKIFHKKTIWNAAKKMNMTEQVYSESKHLIKVLSQPKLRFIKNR